MRKFLLAFTALVGIGGAASLANNYLMTQGTGTTFGSILVAGVNYVQMMVCDATTPTQCSAVSAAGAQKVDGSAVTQPVSIATMPSTPVTGTFWPYTLGQQVAGSSVPIVLTAAQITALTPPTTVAVTQATAASLNATVAPSTLAAWGLVASTQNGATPTNAQLAMGQFNTTPTTITSGNVSPFQLDNAGNLLVNIKAGGGSGGTSLADEAAFTQGTTAITPIGCLFISSYTAITTGHAGVLSCTNTGSLHTTVDNTNANGSATSANSSPVVIASDQAAIAVDSGSTGSAVPAKSMYDGANGSGNLTGEIVCDNSVVYDASTSGETQLVALSSGKSIYVCGFSITTGAAATNVNLAYGTGTACASGTTKLTPAYQLAASSGIVDHSSNHWGGMKTAASNELCINTSGANAVQATVYYTQF